MKTGKVVAIAISCLLLFFGIVAGRQIFNCLFEAKPNEVFVDALKMYPSNIVLRNHVMRGDSIRTPLTLRNTTRCPITIMKISMPCHCQKVTKMGGHALLVPFTLKAFDSIQIESFIDTTGMMRYFFG